LYTLVLYAVGLALLGFLVYRYWEPKDAGSVGLKAMLERENRWEYLPVSALCLGIVVSTTFVRWHMLVRAQDLPFSLRDAFRLGLVGYFFNTFLPGSVGGDLIKAAFIAHEQQRRTVAVSTVMIDRAVGLWGLIALAALVGGAFWLVGDPVITGHPDLMRATRAACIFMAVSVAVFLLLGLLPERRAHRFAQRLHSIPVAGKVLAEFWRSVWIYRVRGLSIIKGLLMSMGGHVFTVLAFYFSALAFQPVGQEAQIPSLLEHFVIVPLGKAFQGFFPTPGGIGGAEFVFGLLYERLGFAPEAGIWANFGTRIAEGALAFLGLNIFLFIKRDLKSALHGGEPQSKIDSIAPEGSSSTTHER
jgi:uncharacterized protein (TIRG00374 family)